MKNILPILADVANGVFATVLAGYFTGFEPSWHVLVGILFAMSPDLDAVPELFKRGKVSASSEFTHDHREALHYPILFVLAGMVFVFVEPFWGWMFLIATMLHFFNDFYGTGWGIALLWPFTNRRYKLLGRRANLLKPILKERGLWKTLSHEERKLRFVVYWSHEELIEYIKRYGEDKWIDKFYLTLNWISGVEYVLFLLALYLLFFTLF